MTYSINLDSPDPRPLGKLTGHVLWSGDKPPLNQEIRLFWETSGKGTQEASVIATELLRFDTDGRASFSFNLPDSPYSFAGHLISLTWALEVVNTRDEALVIQEFILSPDGIERQLSKIDKPQSKGQFLNLHQA